MKRCLLRGWSCAVVASPSGLVDCICFVGWEVFMWGSSRGIMTKGETPWVVYLVTPARGILYNSMWQGGNVGQHMFFF